MGDMRGEIKRMGMVPDQRKINHWKNGVPQNPESWAYRVYHYHLANPPGTTKDICRGIDMPVKQSEKVTKIIKQLRKTKTWKWPNRPDQEQQVTSRLRKAGNQWGEDV